MGDPADTPGGSAEMPMINDGERLNEIGERLGGQVSDVERLLGGASRETWSFRLNGQRLVLRRDPPGALRGGGMAREAALLRAGARAGVPVPDVIASGDDHVVLTWLDGETIARRILRDDRYAEARARLVPQAAQALARLHAGVALDEISGLPHDADPIATLRETLDALGEPHPAIELVLGQLASTRPAATARTVVHGDFRLGNWMVDEHGLVGVLDWELAHIGDPAEDIGWMCVRSWRFGGEHPVAGVTTRDELLAEYAAAGGARVDEQTLRWWEAYGTARWAVICVQQASAHLTGATRSIELAAIGRRVCEVELDLLELLVPEVVTVATTEQLHAARQPPGPHDRPTVEEIVDAVQEWVAGVSMDDRDGFLRRVAHRALDVVRREVALGPALAQRHATRLRGLGVSSDVELAAQIRAGRDGADVVVAVCAAVVDKLRVADPRQLVGRGAT